MISHYRKIWDEKALKDLFQCLRKQVKLRQKYSTFVCFVYKLHFLSFLQFQRRAKGILLSSVGLLSFDWESERITYDSIRKHFDELDFVSQLQKETITCSICDKRLPINAKIDGIEYCSCPKEGHRTNYVCSPKYSLNEINDNDRWQPYLERENIIVWRRKESHGLYAYKGTLKKKQFRKLFNFPRKICRSDKNRLRGHIVSSYVFLLFFHHQKRLITTNIDCFQFKQ